MQRFLFEYEIISSGISREHSIVAKDEADAKNVAVERIADIEFTDAEDIKLGRLVKAIELKDTYYECEGCT
ncbi:hypothetical protein ACQCT6_12640 [Cytobacillus gottheilii]|uniref:Uncharacterized protein n=1 Tax=Cytobacillus gottheilii TaxID=859144 RepID=A0ABX8FER6_9BACI|nr:hypothetical protein [Cytobacillus gottheilii]QVY62511.1 hypothetical protein J1899_05410 [Cytobacillus gottheilii]